MNPGATRYGIVVIGNEVLSGKVEDINSTFLMKELHALGGRVERVAIIPDVANDIAETVKAFSRRFDVVLTSGGVGPTHDDLTFPSVARAFDRPMVFNPRMAEAIKDFFGEERAQVYLAMATLPEGIELIFTDGLLFPVTKLENVFIFPGDPTVLRKKFRAIRDRFAEAPFHLARVFTTLEEGDLAPLLRSLQEEIPHLEVGSYPVYDNPDYKVQVTLESKDAHAVAEGRRRLLAAIPPETVVSVEG
ncbi:MAG TPA: competence/damage-inducible protein A [Planctomycetes bacterium]|nr:competence/damage-inducible protein A [Planctomycetota bacterium]